MPKKKSPLGEPVDTKHQALNNMIVNAARLDAVGSDIFPDMDTFDESKYANTDPNSNLSWKDALRVKQYAEKLGFNFEVTCFDLTFDEWTARGGDSYTAVEIIFTPPMGEKYNAKQLAMRLRRIYKEVRHHGWDAYKMFYSMFNPNKFATNEEILGALVSRFPDLAEPIFSKLDAVEV